MAPPTVRASLTSAPSSQQRQHPQQHQKELAEYYGLYKTARTLARSYQAVAHQKDDQVKALTKEMEELKLKLHEMESQQQRLVHDPLPGPAPPSGPVHPRGNVAGPAIADRTSAPAAMYAHKPAAATLTTTAAGLAHHHTLTRNASLFMNATAATAALPRQHQQVQPQISRGAAALAAATAVAANGGVRHSVDVNLLLAAQRRARSLHHSAVEMQGGGPPAPIAAAAYPELPMPAPAPGLMPPPTTAATSAAPTHSTGMYLRSARSARGTGEVWTARFSEPSQYHPPAGIVTEDAAEDAADTADAGKAKKSKEGKGTLTKAFKKLISRSWKSSRDDHTSRQDADCGSGGGAPAAVVAPGGDVLAVPYGNHHQQQMPHQQQQQYLQHQQQQQQPRRALAFGGPGAAAMIPEQPLALDYYDPSSSAAAGLYDEGLPMDAPQLPMAGDCLGLPPPPPPLALPAPGPQQEPPLAVTLPSAYLLGAPTPQEQLALNAQRLEAVRLQHQHHQQQRLLRQQQQHQQHLLLLQQHNQQQLALQAAAEAAASATAGAAAAAAPPARGLQYLQGASSLGRSAVRPMGHTPDLVLARKGQGQNGDAYPMPVDGSTKERLQLQHQQQLQQLQQHQGGQHAGGAATSSLGPAAASGRKGSGSEGSSGAWSNLVQRSALGQLAQRLKNSVPGSSLRRSYDGALEGGGGAATHAAGGGISALVSSGASVHQSWSSDGLAAAMSVGAQHPVPDAHQQQQQQQYVLRSSAPSMGSRAAAVSASLSSLNIRAAAAQLNHLPPRPSGRAAGVYAAGVVQHQYPQGAASAAAAAINDASEFAHPEEAMDCALLQQQQPPPPQVSCRAAGGFAVPVMPYPTALELQALEQYQEEPALGAHATAAMAVPALPEASGTGHAASATATTSTSRAMAAAAATAQPSAATEAYLEGILGRLKTPSVLLTASAAAQVAAAVQSEMTSQGPLPTAGHRRVASAGGGGPVPHFKADEAVQTDTPGRQQYDMPGDDGVYHAYGMARDPTAPSPATTAATTGDDDTVLRRDLRRSVGVGWRSKALGYKNAAPTAAFHEKTLTLTKVSPAPRDSEVQTSPFLQSQSQCVALVEAALAATPTRGPQPQIDVAVEASDSSPAPGPGAAGAEYDTSPSAPPLAPISTRTPTRTSSSASAAASALPYLVTIDSPKAAAPPSSPTASAEEEDALLRASGGTPFRSPEPHHRHYQHHQQQHAEAAALWRSSSPRARASARAAAHDTDRSPSPNKSERRAAASAGGGRGRAAAPEATAAAATACLAAARSEHPSAGDTITTPITTITITAAGVDQRQKVVTGKENLDAGGGRRRVQGGDSHGNKNEDVEVGVEVGQTKSYVKGDAAAAMARTRSTGTATAQGKAQQTLTATIITTGHVPSADVDGQPEADAGDHSDHGGVSASLWFAPPVSGAVGRAVSSGGSAGITATAVGGGGAGAKAVGGHGYSRYAAAAAEGDSSSAPSTSRSGAWSTEPSPLRPHSHQYHRQPRTSEGAAPVGLDGGATLALAAAKLAAARKTTGLAADGSDPVRRDGLGPTMNRAASLMPTAADVALSDYPSARSNPSASARGPLDVGLTSAAAAAVATAGSSGGAPAPHSGSATPSSSNCHPSVTLAPSPSPPVSASDSSVGSWDPSRSRRNSGGVGGGVSIGGAGKAATGALRQTAAATAAAISPVDALASAQQLHAQASGGGAGGSSSGGGAGGVTATAAATAAALRLQQNLVEAANAAMEPLAARKRGVVRRRSLAAGLDAAGPCTAAEAAAAVVAAAAAPIEGPLLAPRSRHRRWLSQGGDHHNHHHSDESGQYDHTGDIAADDGLSARTAISMTSGSAAVQPPGARRSASAGGDGGDVDVSPLAPLRPLAALQRSAAVSQRQQQHLMSEATTAARKQTETHHALGAEVPTRSEWQQRQQQFLAKRQRGAATAIQRAWRARVAAKAAERVRVRRESRQRERAAIRIQRGWLAHRDRLRLAAESAAAAAAAVERPSLVAHGNDASLPATPEASATPAVAAAANAAAAVTGSASSQPGTPVLVLHPLSQQQPVCVRVPSARMCSSGGLKRRLFQPITSSLDGFDRSGLLDAAERLRLLRGSQSQSEGGWSAEAEQQHAAAVVTEAEYGRRSSSTGGASPLLYMAAPPSDFVLPDNADDDIDHVAPFAAPNPSTAAAVPTAPISSLTALAAAAGDTGTATPAAATSGAPSRSTPASAPPVQLQPRASMDLLSADTAAAALPALLPAATEPSWAPSLSICAPTPDAANAAANLVTAEASPSFAGSQPTSATAAAGANPTSPAPGTSLGSPMFFCGDLILRSGALDSALIRGRVRSRVSGGSHRPMGHSVGAGGGGGIATLEHRSVSGGGGVSLISASWDGGRLISERPAPSLDAGCIVRRSDGGGGSGGGAGFVETLRAMRTDVALLAQLAGAAMDNCLKSCELKTSQSLTLQSQGARAEPASTSSGNPPPPAPQPQPPPASACDIAAVVAEGQGQAGQRSAEGRTDPQQSGRNGGGGGSSATEGVLQGRGATDLIGLAAAATRSDSSYCRITAEEEALQQPTEVVVGIVSAVNDQRKASEDVNVGGGVGGGGGSVDEQPTTVRAAGDDDNDNGGGDLLVGGAVISEEPQTHRPSISAITSATMSYDLDDDDDVLAHFDDGPFIVTTPPTARLLSCGSSTPGDDAADRGDVDSCCLADNLVADTDSEEMRMVMMIGLPATGRSEDTAVSELSAGEFEPILPLPVRQLGDPASGEDDGRQEEAEEGAKQVEEAEEEELEEEEDESDDDDDDDSLSMLQQPLSARTPRMRSGSRLTIAIGTPTSMTTPTNSSGSSGIAGADSSKTDGSGSGGGSGDRERVGGEGRNDRVLASPVRWHTSELWELSHLHPLTPTPVATPIDGAAATVSALRRSWPSTRPLQSNGGGSAAASSGVAAVTAAAVPAAPCDDGGGAAAAAASPVANPVRPWSSIRSAAALAAASGGGPGNSSVIMASADFSDATTDDEVSSVRPQRCPNVTAPTTGGTAAANTTAGGGVGGGSRLSILVEDSPIDNSPGDPAICGSPVVATTSGGAASPVRWHTSQLWELVNQGGAGGGGGGLTPPPLMTPRDVGVVSSVFNISRRSWSGPLPSVGGAAATSAGASIGARTGSSRPPVPPPSPPRPVPPSSSAAAPGGNNSSGGGSHQPSPSISSAVAHAGGSASTSTSSDEVMKGDSSHGVSRGAGAAPGNGAVAPGSSAAAAASAPAAAAPRVTPAAQPSDSPSSSHVVFGGFSTLGGSAGGKPASPSFGLLGRRQLSTSHRLDDLLACTPPPPTPSSPAPPQLTEPLSPAPSPPPSAAPPAPSSQPHTQQPQGVALLRLSHETVGTLQLRAAESRPNVPSPSPSELSEPGLGLGGPAATATAVAPWNDGGGASTPTSAASVKPEASLVAAGSTGTCTPQGASAPPEPSPAATAAPQPQPSSSAQRPQQQPPQQQLSKLKDVAAAAMTLQEQHHQQRQPDRASAGKFRSGIPGLSTTPSTATATTTTSSTSTTTTSKGTASRSDSHRRSALTNAATVAAAAATATATGVGAVAVSPLSESQQHNQQTSSSNSSGSSSNSTTTAASANVSSYDSGTTIAYIIPKGALGKAPAAVAVGVLYPGQGFTAAATAAAAHAVHGGGSGLQERRRCTSSPSITGTRMSTPLADADSDASPRLGLPPNDTCYPASVARRLSVGSAPTACVSGASSTSSPGGCLTPCSAGVLMMLRPHQPVSQYTQHQNPHFDAGSGRAKSSSQVGGGLRSPSFPGEEEEVEGFVGGPMVMTGGVKVRGILSAAAGVIGSGGPGSGAAATATLPSRLCRSSRRQQADVEAFCLYGGLALSCSDDDDSDLEF